MKSMKYVQVIPTLSLAKSSIYYFSNIGLKGVSDRKTCLITINLMKLTAQQHIKQLDSSGGCNPINWLNQTRRNFSIKYLNLNFVTTPKLRGLHSFFLEKVFILAFVGFPFPWFVPRRTFFDTGKLFRENFSNNLQGLTPRVKSR